MSGHGKGGKGLEKSGAKCHCKILHDNIQGIIKLPICCLACCGSAKCISGLIYENVIYDSVTYTKHAKHKTVAALDVMYALKHSGHMLYSFGA